MKKKNIITELLTLNIAFEIFFQIGFAIKINNTSLSIDDVLLLYLLIYSIFYYKLKKIKLKKEYVFLILICIVGYLAYCIFPPNYKIFPIEGDYDKQFIYRDQLKYVTLSLNNVLRFAIMFIYLTYISSYWKKLKIFEKIKLRENIFKLGILHIIILLIEFIAKYTGYYLSIFPIFIKIFGDYKVYQFGVQRLRDGAYWLQGFCLEPGYAGFGLLLFLLSIPRKKNKVKYILLGILFLFLNRSMTSMVVLIFYLFIYFTELSNFKKIKLLLIFIIILIIGISIIDLQPYINRIENIFGNDIRAKSENIRKYNLILAWKFIIRRPLLGYSLGNTRALSFIMSSLENIGFLGTFYWWKLHYVLQKIKKYKLVITIGVFLIIGSIENLYNLLILVIILLIKLREEEV
ncbi:hypothetical protein [Fusobacterium sp.]|uniref:hypothetical protein n=1 Tax=Fusobacterium sp. TaxID=68766 RepID=UPI00260C65CD|nr:hypothetical protein [Fusobacterium sp.]